MKLIFSLILISFLNSCATSYEVVSAVKQKEIMESNNKDFHNNRIKSKIAEIDNQIKVQNEMIRATKNRRKSILSDAESHLNKTMLDNEILSYEHQKKRLLDQRKSLESQIVK